MTGPHLDTPELTGSSRPTAARFLQDIAEADVTDPDGLPAA